MTEPELFEHFEVERVPRWPLMTRLAGGSVVLHAIFLATILYVPAVRDALNIASILSGSDFVSKGYKKTNIEDRAQILNLPKFQYPEGYFYKGDPALPNDPNAPQIIAQAGPNLMTPPVMNKGRRLKPTGIPPTETPSPSPSQVSDPNNPTAQTATPAQPLTPAEAQAELNKISTTNNVAVPKEDEINKKPWTDWLKNTNDMKVQGRLDLSKPVELVIIADFDENGNLAGPPKVIQKEGDPVLVEVAKGMVSAMIDSNVLYYLRDPKTKKLETRQIQISIKIDDQTVTAKVQSDAVSPERAKQLSEGYGLLISMGKITREGKVEADLMKSTIVSYEGKQIIFTFTMPRQEANQLLKKQLQPST